MKEDQKAKETFGRQLQEFMSAQGLGRHIVIRITGVDKTLLSRFLNGHRVPRAWKAFLMGWELGLHYQRRQSLTTPDGRLLCTA